MTLMKVENQLKRLEIVTWHVKQLLDEYDVGGDLALYSQDYSSTLTHRPRSGYLPGITMPLTPGDSSTMSEVQPFTATTPISSIEITENAKGEPRITVKVYNEDITQAAFDALRIYRDTRYELAREEHE